MERSEDCCRTSKKHWRISLIPDLPITFVSYAEARTFKDAKTEFVVFVDDTEDLNEEFYRGLYQIYKDKPQFRKLALVSPALALGTHNIYGWVLNDGMVEQVNSPSARAPYAAQIGYIKNSIIRTDSLNKLDFKFTGDTLMDSARLSLALWNAGLRVYVDPRLHTHPSENVGGTLSMGGGPYDAVLKLFKREMIG